MLYIVEGDYTKASQIFRQAELERVFNHASYAYFNFPLPIARWELEQCDELLRSTDTSHISQPRGLQFNKFITCARLARICKALGDMTAYEEHLTRALEIGLAFETDLKTPERLFQILDKFDQGQKLQNQFITPEEKQ